jgi:membrane protein
LPRPEPSGNGHASPGLLAWIYLGAITTVICAEYNAVQARQLWPRSLLAPFPDNVELTPAG